MNESFTNKIIYSLNAFEPSDVGEDNCERLYKILDDFDLIEDKREIVPVMYAVMEKYAAFNLGSPGPLVHGLESISGYEIELKNSLARCPTDLTVWMVNRILNSQLSKPEREDWLQTLTTAHNHPKSSSVVKSSITEFLEYQNA